MAVVFRHRPIRNWMKELLRSDSVRNFVWLYYAWFIIASIHLTFFSYPVSLIVEPMGLVVYDAWAWMPLFAAPAALGGLALRRGGTSPDAIHGQLLRRDFLGLWMQVGGHACMTVVLAVFIGTALYGAEPGQPTPSAYWLGAYLMGVLFLTAQCAYKIVLGRAR